jgi:hypothetical protein
VAISPDNHWLATGGSDNTARLWDLTDKDPAANPVVLRGHDDEVRAIRISPDNHWLVTGGSNYTARLWDLTDKDLAAKHLPAISNVLIRVFQIKKSEGRSKQDFFEQMRVLDKLIEPDGRSEQDVFLEQMSKLIDLARAAAGRNLTADEWKGHFPGESYRKTFPDLPGL